VIASRPRASVARGWDRRPTSGTMGEMTPGSEGTSLARGLAIAGAGLVFVGAGLVFAGAGLVFAGAGLVLALRSGRLPVDPERCGLGHAKLDGRDRRCSHARCAAASGCAAARCAATGCAAAAARCAAAGCAQRTRDRVSQPHHAQLPHVRRGSGSAMGDVEHDGWQRAATPRGRGIPWRRAPGRALRDRERRGSALAARGGELPERRPCVGVDSGVACHHERFPRARRGQQTGSVGPSSARSHST
jgi:hypothetical protein